MNLKRWIHREKMKVMNDEQLTKLLQKGGYDLSRPLSCYKCNDLITLEGVSMVEIINAKVMVICHKPECIKMATEEQS